MPGVPQVLRWSEWQIPLAFSLARKVSDTSLPAQPHWKTRWQAWTSVQRTLGSLLSIIWTPVQTQESRHHRSLLKNSFLLLNVLQITRKKLEGCFFTPWTTSLSQWEKVTLSRRELRFFCAVRWHLTNLEMYAPFNPTILQLRISPKDNT